MPEVQEKVCQNCAHFEIFTDKKNKIHYLCYRGDIANIFFFGPKQVSPNSVCQGFLQKTR